MRDDRVYLLDILEAIERIEKYTAQGREAFEVNELIQTWVVHHIQIIGEATRKLSQDLRIHYSEVPWTQIMAMRNILVHDYFRIDLDEVWLVIEGDILVLKERVEFILKELE
ncbi:MAG: DUF86 domain-containing protein [Chloroflexi bacterium]|nr:DUF86 domain-containing protein [Chloroflexota bacterium]